MPTHSPVENGTSTDHPVPGLPFVDDVHLAAALHPHAAPFTHQQPAVRRDRPLDPNRSDFVWLVHTHARYGRQVLLYENAHTPQASIGGRLRSCARTGRQGSAKHGGRISEEDLAEETGLTPEQIEAGVTWQSLEYLRWREQFGGDDDPGSAK